MRLAAHIEFYLFKSSLPFGVQKMKRFQSLARWMTVASLLTFSATKASAAFTVQFDPAQTTVNAPGTFTIDLTITHDGSADASTISGFTIDISEPAAGLTFANPSAGDLNFQFAPNLSTSPGLVTIGAAGFGDVNVGNTATVRLMTLDFIVDNSVTNTTFPINMTLRNANRGGFFDIASEFTVNNGSFNVTAVPEPSSFAILALVTTAVVRRRRRKDSKATK